MGVVKSPPHKFCLFLVVSEGKDLGDLFDGHLVVGENPKGQSGVCLVAEILGEDRLEVLTLFLLEATNLTTCHLNIFFM